MASPRGATWHFPIGLYGPLKSPLVGDMWQPVVLPCGMMMSTSYTECHPTMSASNISSTDDDVSPADWF
jgi:hypothetical protein